MSIRFSLSKGARFSSLLPPELILGNRLKERFLTGTTPTNSHMVDDGSGVISSWAGSITGLAVTGALTDRPTFGSALIRGYSALRFDTNRLVNVGISSILPVGSASGGMVIFGVNNSTDTSQRTLVAYGSTTERRRVFTINGARNPAADANTGSLTDTGHSAAGLFVIIAEWAAGAITLRINGADGGSFTNAFNTGNTAAARLAIGGFNLSSGSQYAQADFRDILFYSGALLLDEKQQIEAWYPNEIGVGYEVLIPPHPYRIAPAPNTLAQNLSELNATMTAASGQSTPDQEADMAVPPTVTTQSGATLPTGTSNSARWTTTPNLITFCGPWKETVATNYRRSPSSVSGLVGAGDITGTYMRGAVRTNTTIIAALVAGVLSEKYRLVIRFPTEFGGDGKWRYVDNAGISTLTTAGQNWLVQTYPTKAWRDARVEAEGSGSVDGWFVATGDSITALPIDNGGCMYVNGDSFAAATSNTPNWNGFVPLLADRLGIPNVVDDAQPGTGYFARGSSGLLDTARERVGDVNDDQTSVAARAALGVTGLTGNKVSCLFNGENDFGAPAADTQIEVGLMLDSMQAAKPGVPIIVASPWDTNAPAAPVAGFAAVKAGIQAACAGRRGVAFIDLQGIAFNQIGGGNIHPTKLGHQQLAVAIAPLIRAAVTALLASV